MKEKCIDEDVRNVLSRLITKLLYKDVITGDDYDDIFKELKAKNKDLN